MKLKTAWRRLLNGKIKFVWIVTPVMAHDSNEPKESYKLKSGERWVTYKPNGDNEKGRHCVINGATGEITQGNPAIKGKNIDELPHKKHPIPEEKYQRWLARQEKKKTTASNIPPVNNKSRFFERFTGIPDSVEKIDVAETTGLKLKDGTPCTITTRRPVVDKDTQGANSEYRVVYTLKVDGDLTPEMEKALKNSDAKYNTKKDEWTVVTDYNRDEIKELAEWGPTFFGDDTFSEEYGNTTSHEYTRDMTREKPPESFTPIPGISDDITDMKKKTWGITVHNTTGKAILYSTDNGENAMIIDFDKFPSGDDRKRIKEAGFKWHPDTKLWYKQGNNPSKLYEDIANASHKIETQENAKEETYRRENRLGGYGEETSSPEFIRKINEQSLNMFKKAFGNNWNNAKSHIKNFHGVPVVLLNTPKGTSFTVCSKYLDKSTKNMLKDIGLSPSYSPSSKIQSWEGRISIDKGKLDSFIKNHISELDNTQRSLLNE